MNTVSKILTGLMLTFFVGVMFVSLFHMSSMMSGGEMMMHESVPMGGGCPFMAHEQTLCPMNFMDHIGAWQETFAAVVPGVVWLIAAASFLVAAINLAPNLLGRPRYFISIPPGRLQKRIYTFTYRHLQDLFSAGILHPKLF